MSRKKTWARGKLLKEWLTQINGKQVKLIIKIKVLELENNLLKK